MSFLFATALPIIFDQRKCVCFSGRMTFVRLFLLVLVERLYEHVFALCGFPPAVEGLSQPPPPSLHPAKREIK